MLRAKLQIYVNSYRRPFFKKKIEKTFEVLCFHGSRVMRKIDKFACDLCAFGGIAKVRRTKKPHYSLSELLYRYAHGTYAYWPARNRFRQESSFCLADLKGYKLKITMWMRFRKGAQSKEYTRNLSSLSNGLKFRFVCELRHFSTKTFFFYQNFVYCAAVC